MATTRCCLIIFVMLLANDPNLIGRTRSQVWSPVASAGKVDLPSFSWMVERSATPENLVKAVEKGDLSTVENLIGRGDVDVNYNTGEALSTAARLGYLKIGQALLQAGAHPDGAAQNSTTDPDSGWPLYWAATNNHTDVVDLLLDAGADVNAHPTIGGTIIGAVENGHLVMVNKLLEAGFDPNTDGGFAVIAATRGGYIDVVNAFIEAGTDVNAKDGWMVVSAAASGHLEIVEALLESGVIREDYETALSSAAGNGHLSIVKFLLEKGANPSAGHILRNAAESGHLEVVRALLEAGSNIAISTLTDPEGSPIHYAAISGHIDVIDLLVQYGADINTPFAKDIWWDIYGDIGFHGTGWTAMHLAARWGHQLILKKMVDLGADINAVDDKGYTPLHVAVINMKLKVVQELLKLCADTNLKNKKGETALDLAQKTVSLDMSDHPQPSRMLKDLATDILQEKVKSYPYTEYFMKVLARDVHAVIDANKTMQELLEDQTPPLSWSYIQVATRRVFEDKAKSGVLKVFKDHSCKVQMGDHFQPEIGTHYQIMCECLNQGGRKLSIKHVPKGTVCGKAEDIRN